MEKLAKLALPPLAAKSFLDVGCNTGYYCGFAFFEGAFKIVGIDKNAECIAMAKSRFPQCSFMAGDWEYLADLVNGSCFDVILCASALHYSEDQPGLIKKMMERLAPEGVLVLEIGMIINCREWPETKPGWHLVTRDKDERLFPSCKGLENMLKPWSFKIMGESAKQIGDPVNRYVAHVRKRQKLAVIITGAPGSGKSELAARLADKIKVIHGDGLLYDMFLHPDKFGLAEQITARSINIQRIDREIFKLFNSGKGGLLAKAALGQAKGEDFIFDGFIPEQYEELFQQELARAGFRVIVVKTPKPAYSPLELASNARQEARKYEMFLTAMSHAKR